MSTPQHSSLTKPFTARADLPNTHPLASYLLQLMTIKRSNLCVSADVTSTSALLKLAEEVGDSICVLKTHADIIDHFSERTITGLQEISRRKKFLIFEDRKFGDIGSKSSPPPLPPKAPSYKPHPLPTTIQPADPTPPPGTVQKQYTSGALRIARWAHITNAHLLPGPSIITALSTAASTTLSSITTSVHTEISTGTPRSSLELESSSSSSAASSSAPASFHPSKTYERTGRKGSIVTATTTISQTFESSPTPISLSRTVSVDCDDNDDDSDDRAAALLDLGDPPHSRGLLLLAQMSSEGNLMTAAYTSACVAAARENSGFVMGFVAQTSLNRRAGDAFLCFTPGVGLPPEGEADDDEDENEDDEEDDDDDDEDDDDDDDDDDEEEGGARGERGNQDGWRGGDGLGQQYRTPRSVVLGEGCDIVIVGRGILGARDRRAEAERYRREAWRAYRERVGGKNRGGASASGSGGARGVREGR